MATLSISRRDALRRTLLGAGSLMLARATPPPAKPKSEPSAHLQELEKSFARQLGMRVQIRSAARKGKGRVIIHYASLDQFDQLLSRLGVQTEKT